MHLFGDTSVSEMAVNEEAEIWSERAGLADAFITPMIIFNVFFLPFIYLARLATRYTLTNERLIISRGLLAKKIDEVELFRIKDTRLEQSMFQRLCGYGTVSIQSTDATGFIAMTHLPNARARREQLRKLSNNARAALGVRTVVSE
jgi:uncharacterized membrane protein YdbT with pleckstrin-like domain